MAMYRAMISRFSSVMRLYANCSEWLGATPMVCCRVCTLERPTRHTGLTNGTLGDLESGTEKEELCDRRV